MTTRTRYTDQELVDAVNALPASAIDKSALRWVALMTELVEKYGKQMTSSEARRMADIGGLK